jgi:recombination protein RecA
VKVVKNKHAPPFKTIQLELEFGKGISRDSEVIDLGCKHNLIIKAGASYYSIGGHNFNGKDAIKQYFQKNEGAREELITKIRENVLQKEQHRSDLHSESDKRESEEEVVTEVEV